MPDTGNMPLLIRTLCEPDSEGRARAAAEIFRRSCELAQAATATWFADPNLAKSFRLNDSGFPTMTAGVAVEPETFERIRQASGSPPLADVPPDQDAKEFELHFPGGVRLDILTTGDPGATGAIARYLSKFGEGIQQIEFLAEDVDGATEILRARFGLEPIYPAARLGADGTHVNFFLVSTPADRKLLIELVEGA